MKKAKARLRMSLGKMPGRAVLSQVYGKINTVNFAEPTCPDKEGDMTYEHYKP
jgi:hypothetical protein